MTDGITATSTRRHRRHRASRGPGSHGERTGTVGTHTGQRGWPERLRRWTVLALVAFALNMLWELVQLPLYLDREELEASVLYLAAIDDAGLILVVAFAAGFVHRRSRSAAWTLLLLGLFATAAARSGR